MRFFSIHGNVEDVVSEIESELVNCFEHAFISFQMELSWGSKVFSKERSKTSRQLVWTKLGFVGVLS